MFYLLLLLVAGGLVALGAHYERIDPPRPMVKHTKDD